MKLNKDLQIVKIHLRYGWRWRINRENNTDSCLICQQDFYSTCSKCIHPIDCHPALGSCNHIFHLHCIEQWLQTNNLCPICRKSWAIQKIYQIENVNVKSKASLHSSASNENKLN